MSDSREFLGFLCTRASSYALWRRPAFECQYKHSVLHEHSFLKDASACELSGERDRGRTREHTIAWT
jgi:hypothetical protein